MRRAVYRRIIRRVVRNMEEKHCRLLNQEHFLICHELLDDHRADVELLACEFCGSAYGWFDMDDQKKEAAAAEEAAVFFCGDVKGFRELGTGLDITVVREFSHNYEPGEENLVPLGAVPLNVNGLGVFLRQFYRPDDQCFEELTAAHEYQHLTESNKEGVSYRKGIYLSEVDLRDGDLHYRLLRCSTNFDGPTESFAQCDAAIVDDVDAIAELFFEDPAPLNHVLAQTYHNSVVDGADKKAKIKRHSDKTEDMPCNGVIAFCTFYSKDVWSTTKASPVDRFDRVHGASSVLTRLLFRLKDCVKDRQPVESRDRTSLPWQFTLTLYPGSVFVMPLRTNRLYTHEILPSVLPVVKLPTRLGYVVRCSATDAVYRITGDQQGVYIEDGKVKLRQATDADAEELKALYRRENMTDEDFDYGLIPYTLNKGDLMIPKTFSKQS